MYHGGTTYTCKNAINLFDHMMAIIDAILEHWSPETRDALRAKYEKTSSTLSKLSHLLLRAEILTPEGDDEIRRLIKELHADPLANPVTGYEAVKHHIEACHCPNVAGLTSVTSEEPVESIHHLVKDLRIRLRCIKDRLKAARSLNKVLAMVGDIDVIEQNKKLKAGRKRKLKPEEERKANAERRKARKLEQARQIADAMEIG